MPWVTPSLAQVRATNRDYISSRLLLPLIPNSDLRVLADAGGGMAHSCMKYIDWLSLQLLPDTAERVWLDRQANIWLVNADGSKGRLPAIGATGMAVILTGTSGAVIPSGAIYQSASPAAGGLIYQVTAQTTIGSTRTTVPLAAVSAGAVTNLDPGTVLATVPVSALPQLSVVSMTGGTDEESDDELRSRVLERIQNPPMGGDAEDYVRWARSFPGVTRAWLSPKEMGIGTITLRFMMDDLRANNNGFPTPIDVQAVRTYIDTVRPVTVLDAFVVAPIPEPVSFTLTNLDSDDASTIANISASVSSMFFQKGAPAFAHNGIAQPAQTIFEAWVTNAVMEAEGVTSFDIAMGDHVMPTPGSLAVLGNILLA